MRIHPARQRGVLVTGATGVVGTALIQRLLERTDFTVHALVRTPASAALLSARLGAGARLSTVIGDVTQPDCGLVNVTRDRLRRRIDTVVHAAANTSFAQPLEQARAVNTAGTRNLIELVQRPALHRFVYVSTAYVAGCRTGDIPECELDDSGGFVNGYEQSKQEAEQLVRASGLPFVILRPSTIICDDTSGSVTQLNAVHRALRVFHAGYGSLMPGAEDTPLDVVTGDYVSEGIHRIGLADGTAGGTYHLCTGAAAPGVGVLLDRAHALWSRDRDWRRRGIMRPAFADLATYRLFEKSVEETGDMRLSVITRSLSHFVPQLALPKRFDTARADAVLGRSAPAVASYWDAVVENLVSTRWNAAGRAA